MDNSRGQVTIFVIIAILLVIGIVGVILLIGDADIEAPEQLSVRGVVEKCVEDVVDDSVVKMLANGGQIVPTQSISYQGEEYNYLCYQGDYYLPCYNIHPMLEASIEEEIREDTKAGVQSCFNGMRMDFEDQGFDVSGGTTSYTVDLLPGKVEINLKKRIDVVKGATSQTFEDFDTEILSPIYDLVKVARDVVNSESQYCNFEYNGYVLLYPQYEIRKIDYRDSKLYRLIDRRSGAEFRFAVRSCAFAPGI